MVNSAEADSEVNSLQVIAEVINDDEDAGTEIPTVSKQNLGNTSDTTIELVLVFANRDELLEEAVKLREKVKALQALAPKANLITQNNNLIAKNRKLVESVEMKNIEILNLKPIKEKLLQLSKKLGNEKHLELRANTKLEITNYVGNALKKTYGDIDKMHFSPPADKPNFSGSIWSITMQLLNALAIRCFRLVFMKARGCLTLPHVMHDLTKRFISVVIPGQ